MFHLSALIAACLVVVATEFAQAAGTKFVVNTIHLNNSRCSNGSSTMVTLVGEPGACLQFTNSRVAESASVQYSCDERTVFSTSNQCSGSMVSEPYDCAVRVGGVSTTSECVNFPAQRVYSVEYFSSETCSGDHVDYVAEAGYFVSGVLDLCVASFVSDSAFETSKTVVNSNGGLTTNVYGSENCKGNVIRSFTSSVDGSCQNATGSAATSATPFYTVKLLVVPAQQYLGQVNLNADAQNLNAQIAGASIGVLCGFTALLILISMTGILG